MREKDIEDKITSKLKYLTLYRLVYHCDRLPLRLIFISIAMQYNPLMTLSDIQGQAQPWTNTKSNCNKWALAVVALVVLAAAVVVALWLTGVIQFSSSSSSNDTSSSSSSTGSPGGDQQFETLGYSSSLTDLPFLSSSSESAAGQGNPNPSSNEQATCQAPSGWNGTPSPTCALNGTICTPPPWPAQWSLTMSTAITVSNTRSYWMPPVTQPYGLVSLDWSNARVYWRHSDPADSTCEATSSAIASALKAQSPQTRVMMYQDLQSPFLAKESNRAVMLNPFMQSYFIQVESDGDVYSTTYNYLGTEYYWDWQNASTAAQFASMIVSAVLENGMDGVHMESILTRDDLGQADLSSAQVNNLYYCMQQGEAQAQASLVNHGAYAFNAFGYDLFMGPGIQATGPTQQGTYSETLYNCSYFMQVYCAAMSITTMVFNQQSPNQSIAAFLLGRGPNSYIGYPWYGFDAWGPYDPTFLLQPGEPQGSCAQVSPGVYSRPWTYGDVTLNCNTWQASIPTSGTLWSPAVMPSTRWIMPLQGNLTEITTGYTATAMQFTEGSSYYISNSDTFTTTSRGLAWQGTGQDYLAVYPKGGFLAPSYTQTFWIQLTAQSGAAIAMVVSAPYANGVSGTVATDGTQHFFMTYILNNNLLAFVHGPADYHTPLCSYSIPASALFNYWLHIGVTFDETSLTASLYVNGTLVNQTTNNPPYTGQALLHFGYFPDISYAIEGNLQWLTWANYALSAAAIQQAYLSTL